MIRQWPPELRQGFWTLWKVEFNQCKDSKWGRSGSTFEEEKKMHWGLEEGSRNDQDKRITNEQVFHWKEQNRKEHFQGCKEEQHNLTEQFFPEQWSALRLQVYFAWSPCSRELSCNSTSLVPTINAKHVNSNLFPECSSNFFFVFPVFPIFLPQTSSCPICANR